MDRTEDFVLLHLRRTDWAEARRSIVTFLVKRTAQM